MSFLKRIALVLALLMLASNVSYATIRSGDSRKVVASAGTAEALVSTSTYVNTVSICAETDNTGTIVVGDSPIASLSTREGTPLSAGACMSISAYDSFDLLNWKLDTTVSGDGVTYLWMLEA